LSARNRAISRGNCPRFSSNRSSPGPCRPDAALPTDFAKVFAYSSLARIRRGSTSITVLGQSTTLLTYRKGAAVLDALRIATAFFGKGQFTSESLEEKNGAFTCCARV
jgi:hypothetical protein